MDLLLDPSHDLADSARQESVREQLEDVVFLAAALDCSTKSRAREIPKSFKDGREMPRPLRSDRHPEGLPDLPLADQRRVSRDNLACAFILEEMDKIVARGGGSPSRESTSQPALGASQGEGYGCNRCLV